MKWRSPTRASSRTGASDSSNGEFYPWEPGQIYALTNNQSSTLEMFGRRFISCSPDKPLPWWAAVQNSMLPLGGGALSGGKEYDDAEAADAISVGAGFGTDGLKLSDVTAWQSGGACSNDWCSELSTHPDSTPFFDAENAVESVPDNRSRSGLSRATCRSCYRWLPCIRRRFTSFCITRTSRAHMIPGIVIPIVLPAWRRIRHIRVRS